MRECFNSAFVFHLLSPSAISGRKVNALCGRMEKLLRLFRGVSKIKVRDFSLALSFNMLGVAHYHVRK